MFKTKSIIINNLAILIFILLSCLIVKIECDGELTAYNNNTNKPLYSLNQYYNETELQSLNNNIFITQAFNFIFTGS